MIENNTDSKQNNMDDILSSIRKTINEDLDTVMDTPISGSNSVLNEPSLKNAPQTVDGIQSSAENVLELTQVVQEDGTIVDLKVSSQAVSSNIIDLNNVSAKATSTSTPMTPQMTDSIDPQLQVASHPADINTQNVSTAFSQSFYSDDKAIDSMTDTSSQLEDTFISNETIQESIAALAALNNVTKPTIVPQQSMPSTASKTIEDMVRDMLRPMLKDWLDTHLPFIIKQKVQEQIEKVFNSAPGPK